MLYNKVSSDNNRNLELQNYIKKGDLFVVFALNSHKNKKYSHGYNKKRSRLCS